jgi:hypothetical protein
VLQKNRLEQFGFSGSGRTKDGSVIGLFTLCEPALKREEVIKEIRKGKWDSAA